MAGGDEVSHKCPECGRVFDNIRGLRTHYSQAHPEFVILSVQLNKRQKKWIDSNVTNFSEWVGMRIDEEMKEPKEVKK